MTTQYAIHSICFIASKGEKGIATGKEISKGIQAPKGYIVKVLGILCRGGIIQTIRGMNGGYVLAKNANNLCVWDIIQCTANDKAVKGPAYKMLRDVDKEIKKMYKSITIQALIKGE